MDDRYDPDSIVLAQNEEARIYEEIGFGSPQVDRVLAQMGDPNERFSAARTPVPRGRW